MENWTSIDTKIIISGAEIRPIAEPIHADTDTNETVEIQITAISPTGRHERVLEEFCLRDASHDFHDLNIRMRESDSWIPTDWRIEAKYRYRGTPMPFTVSIPVEHRDSTGKVYKNRIYFDHETEQTPTQVKNQREIDLREKYAEEVHNAEVDPMPNDELDKLLIDDQEGAGQCK